VRAEICEISALREIAAQVFVYQQSRDERRRTAKCHREVLPHNRAEVPHKVEEGVVEEYRHSQGMQAVVLMN
jgi:hypothetical protein